MSLLPELYKITNVTKTEDTPWKFSSVKNQTSLVQLELWTSSEQTFESKTLPMLKTEEVSTQALNEMMSLKLCWLTWRKWAATFSAHYGSSLVIDTPLTESDQITLSEIWQRKHRNVDPFEMIRINSLLN